MGIFDKNRAYMGTGPIIGVRTAEESIGLGKKIKTIFTDVETEGKKQGYDRASDEYEPIYRKIKKEYDKTKKTLEEVMVEKDDKFSKLVTRLQELESKKENLEKKIKNKAKKVSLEFDIPLSSVESGMATGTLLIGPAGFSLIDVIYNYKESKLRAAEEKGYAEAKEIYENKINELKENLRRLKNKGNSEIREMMGLINDAMNEIIEKETQLAELEIILNSYGG